ncbi:tetratricopeptide repeat protein [Micromonospora sp. NBC_01655]|uniref:tetratricopeptide repeat protein n=1 Tax=Micromonospora sp. NBC_01655 TaxID=2975983 RepID=UPI00225702F3|nr:tetratricopeptide repeat protein [Micromonospora sp. NBC_01655]MCX4473613.1 tetratricopeptide repeat protein [Micromonospora sp. NBC_01655]
MSSAFGDLTGQAHHLVSAGDLAGAQQLLSDALSDADPRPDHASPELADAAGLQARVLVALGEPHSARGWAAFAYAATTRLYSRSDPRTVSAAATLAAVLHRVGSYARAARLYSDVIIELTASDGPESLRVLAAHADLATVEYARGQCEVARERLQDAWELHREVYGDGHPSGIKMLARLGAMQRDCGEFAEAHDHLALARELCRQHLAPDDPLAVQVAGLARAAANPDHVCARTPTADREEPAEAPVVPAARVPPAAEGPPTYQPAWPPEDDPHPPGVPAPRTPPDEAAQHTAAGAAACPGGDEGWPGEAPGRAADDDPWTRDPAAPETAEDDPWVREHAAPGGPARADDDRWARDGDARGGQSYPADDDRWPDEPGWSAANSLPPTVVGLAGATDEPAGVRAVHPPVTREDRSRLLPVLVPRPPAPPQRRLTPLVVLGGVTVVVLGAAAVIAGVARVDGPNPGPSPSVTAPPGSGAPGSDPSGVSPPGGAPASPRAAASPGTPPGGFTLRDNRDNIALRWTYPAGANGPVVLARGQSGQEPRAFETLPPGSTSLLVYGLDRTADYCFTVAVVWSVETVGRTGQVCTNRR